LISLAGWLAFSRGGASEAMKIAKYDTNLTDAQWTYLKPMLPKPAKRGRPRKDRRRIVDAVLYLVKWRCPWRYLPVDFPNRKTVYHVFRQWIASHRWAVMHDTLRVLVRSPPRQARPSHSSRSGQSKRQVSRGTAGASATTQPNGSKAANGICWWMRWD
jgi:transposase